MKKMIDLLKKYKKLLILLVVIAIIFLSPIRQYLSIGKITSLLNDVKEHPLSGVIYIAIYILGVLLLLPGLALTALAGVTFGFIKGSILVIIASNIGCHLTFFITRYVGGDFAKKVIKDNSFVSNMSKKMEKNGFLVMLYMRLLPIFPFNVINYASGLTPIKYKDYAIATFIGMLPGTLVYVYVAASATNIKDNPIGLIISIGILVVFTIGTKILTKRKTDYVRH